MLISIILKIFPLFEELSVKVSSPCVMDRESPHMSMNAIRMMNDSPPKNKFKTYFMCHLCVIT